MPLNCCTLMKIILIKKHFMLRSKLTKVRHRCIVKLYGYCSHSKCKFLVYDLIEKGSFSIQFAGGTARQGA
jgi:hypothetical protein